MQALLFLSTRSFLNATRRAFTSGRRMFTLLFAIGYWALIVFRPFSRHSAAAILSPQFLRAISPEVVELVIFGGFVAMTFLLSLTTLTSRGGFRQADVDVLFATPISPRAVMFFRMFRDYLATLITPFFFALFGGTTGFMMIRSIFAQLHGDAPLAVRATAEAWFLVSLAWVCLGYGVGFFVNRSDLLADRNKKILDWVIGLSMLTAIGYAVYAFEQNPTVQGAAVVAHSPLIRIVFFTATAACWMIEGALHRDPLFLLAGAGILIGIAALGIRLALSQLPFMYDQAAVKGFGAVERRMLQRNNDYYGLSAQRARDGKYKIGRISRWIGRMNFGGASALIWKEILLQLRAGSFIYILFGAIQLALVLIPVIGLSGSGEPRLRTVIGTLLFVTQGIGVLMLTMNSAVGGFIEMLKRVDFQKPLPFRPAGTVFWEVASKCIPNVLIGGVAALVAIAIQPSVWDYALGSEVFVVGMSLVVSATVFLVTVAFSDAGDASQRGFRGILILLGILICGTPGAALLIVLIAITHLNPLLASIPATIINVGFAILVAVFGGVLYDSFNPSE